VMDGDSTPLAFTLGVVGPLVCSTWPCYRKWEGGWGG